MLKKYLVKNGTVLSVLDGSERKADILVEDGIITRIEEDLCDSEADVFDAEGMYVSVVWLDAHCHFANPGGESIGIDPTEDLLRQGVTYALDLGTLGPENFETYQETIKRRTDLKYMSYLNIARKGVASA